MTGGGTTIGGGVTIAINLAIAASSITKCSVMALKAAAVDASLLATRVVSCDSSRFVACRSDHRALYEGTIISPEIGGCRSYYAPLPEGLRACRESCGTHGQSFAAFRSR